MVNLVVKNLIPVFLLRLKKKALKNCNIFKIK